MGTAVNA